MFDPIPPARLVALLGDLLRESARWDRPLDEFRTSQLLSASSVARYLAAELAGSEPDRRRFVDNAVALVERTRAEATEHGWREALDTAAGAFAAGVEPLGEVATELLRATRGCPDPTGAAFAREFRGLLAELADRHVALLAAREPR